MPTIRPVIGSRNCHFFHTQTHRDQDQRCCNIGFSWPHTRRGGDARKRGFPNNTRVLPLPCNIVDGTRLSPESGFTDKQARLIYVSSQPANGTMLILCHLVVRGIFMVTAVSVKIVPCRVWQAPKFEVNHAINAVHVSSNFGLRKMIQLTNLSEKVERSTLVRLHVHVSGGVIGSASWPRHSHM